MKRWQTTKLLCFIRMCRHCFCFQCLGLCHRRSTIYSSRIVRIPLCLMTQKATCFINLWFYYFLFSSLQQDPFSVGRVSFSMFHVQCAFQCFNVPCFMVIIVCLFHVCFKWYKHAHKKKYFRRTTEIGSHCVAVCYNKKAEIRISSVWKSWTRKNWSKASTHYNNGKQHSQSRYNLFYSLDFGC